MNPQNLLEPLVRESCADTESVVQVLDDAELAQVGGGYCVADY